MNFKIDKSLIYKLDFFRSEGTETNQLERKTRCRGTNDILAIHHDGSDSIYGYNTATEVKTDIKWTDKLIHSEQIKSIYILDKIIISVCPLSCSIKAYKPIKCFVVLIGELGRATRMFSFQATLSFPGIFIKVWNSHC